MSNPKLYSNYFAACMIFSISLPWWALFIPAVISGFVLAINKQTKISFLEWVFTNRIYLVSNYSFKWQYAWI